MSRAIDKISIRGFKSIETLDDFPLSNLNILIGANGAGKSNFVDFFRMLRAIAEGAFQQFVNEHGGGDGFLFLGPKKTGEISARLDFGGNWYRFSLKPTADGSLQLTGEQVGHGSVSAILSAGTRESALSKSKDFKGHWHKTVYESVSNWTVYHFHDTSALAPMRRDQSARDWERLRPDASNIAAFLLQLKTDETGSYELIRDTIRLIAPFFDDFLLRPQTKGNDQFVRLEWQQKGSDFPFQPTQLSDGTIRFICLATALTQPNPPATILIDEPELGLHPYAISMLADLIKSASARTQVIVSTQSATLLDYFEPSDIVVVSRVKGRSNFERLDSNLLSTWLEDYSVGELWQKNVVQGGPTSE
ncbi:hypothetical protein Q31b_01090 [Novipirellula aureliae]|uniref:ATPase AAA-type core domain-containing protein n=1 Tax=Novipirellula aureliae TaxID=2527966 RepID=A0A5C6E7Z2_9BACT|nr:AAA family ATPase [Novipirellula aureliae]TWU44938.1 hypothetical protein Q31b_01090 [Novipirellula aureliae]